MMVHQSKHNTNPDLIPGPGPMRFESFFGSRAHRTIINGISSPFQLAAHKKIEDESRTKAEKKKSSRQQKDALGFRGA